MVVCAGSYNWPATPQENDCICGVRAGLADASTSLIGSKAGSSLVFCILGFLAFPRTGSQNGVQQETVYDGAAALKLGPQADPTQGRRLQMFPRPSMRKMLRTWRRLLP